MKKPSAKKPAGRFLTLLLLFSLTPTPGWAAPSMKEIIAFLPVSKEHYTKEEVAALVTEIWLIAEEEMEQTALEAAKAAAADEAARRAVSEALTAQLQEETTCLIEENREMGGTVKKYRTLLGITGGIALGTTALALAGLLIN